MTLFEELIAQRIRREGPIGLADYMTLALLHPEHGYYRHRDPLGRGGDFVTAPEISQMFGELIGLWCADYWDRMGRPAPFALVELGPGRGTLMADALRAAGKVPGFLVAKELVLVEASPALRRRQQDSLDEHRPRWIASVADLRTQSTILIANEFFDALPVRQFARRNGYWHETMVGLSEDAAGFRFVVSRETARQSPLLDRLYPEAREGDVAELPNAALSLVHEIARLLGETERRGAALIIDYGYYPSRPHPTLQAVKAHRRHNPLAQPGEADLTTHINFQALLTAASEAGARAWGPVDQRDFLHALGIDQRAAGLMAQATPAQQSAIQAAMHRLTDADQMGVLFKAVALTAPAAPCPAGFAPTAVEENAGKV